MVDHHRELLYAKVLRRLVPDFPVEELIRGESPDFTIDSAGAITGLEITVFHLDPEDGKRPHQESQAIKDRIVALACQLHQQRGGQGLYVSTFFRDPLNVTMRTSRDLAAGLAEAVLATEVPSDFDGQSYRVPLDRLPPGIIDVTIHASVDGQDRLWSADAGGWVASVQPADVQAVLDRKESMYGVALAKCNRVWLVIVNDVFSRAAQAELSDAARAHEYEHRFDRAFWLELHQQRVFDLTRNER